MQSTVWRLSQGDVAGSALTKEYDLLLVALSFAVAVLAGYSAMKVVERLRAAKSTKSRHAWLALGAASMGAGTWAMHFIGMLALTLPVAVSYDLTITLLSIVPGIAASGAAIRVLGRPEQAGRHVIVGGLIMAIGIGGMHYLGMEAMRMDARMAYVPWLFGASIAVAALLATGAIGVQARLARGVLHSAPLETAVGAVLLGSAVAGMHYTAMSAARFYPGESMGTPALVIPPLWMAFAVTVVGVLVLGLAIIGTFVDEHLTEVSSSLVSTRQRSRHIIDNSPLAIVSATHDGAVVDWNRRAAEIFGWPFVEAVGRDLSTLLGLTAEDGEQLTSEALYEMGGEDRTGMELTARTRTGARVPLELSLSRLEQGEHPLVIGFAQDISERFEDRRNLEQARADAEAAAIAKGEFLANMSHEIRTPMNGVIGMTQLLLDSELTEEQRDRLEIVHRSGESLLAIINDILDFSKVEAGKLEIELIDFDVRAAVEDVTTMLAPKADDTGIELICSIRAGVPHTVGGDPGRLRQILVNLLSNALKFTKQGEVVVAVEVEEETDDDVLLSFQVRDTGIGIAPDRVGAIFDSFTQADSTTTRHFGGTGLGLAISSRLAELMGGTISVESTVGEGSTFAFTVRCEKREQAVEAAPTPIRPGRVLIVDDNETNRKVVRAQLAVLGLPNEDADGADAALDELHAAAARGEPFDVALLDYQMPGMDGAELGRRIKEDPAIAGTDLVMLTSVGRRGDASRYQELGFAAYLVKPIKQSYLFDCLGKVLSRRGAGEAEPAKNRIITKHSLTEDRTRNRVSILLVEDNPVNQMVAQGLVKKLGHACDVAENGAEALAALERADASTYGLILMDCQMPVMDGFEATRRIRLLDGPVSRIPILAMTANAMEGDRELCLEAGMDDYLTKPIDPSAFRNAIDRALRAESPPETLTAS